MNCFRWINGVPVHADIRWISCEVCHPIFFTCFPRVFFTWIIGVPIHVHIWWIYVMVKPGFPSDVYSTWGFFTWIIGVGLHILHRSLCSLFQPDTDGPHVSKRRQLSQQTRGLDPMLFQCWSRSVGGGSILKQHWVKSSCWLSSTQVSVYTRLSPSIICSAANQGTFSRTAGQSQAYYNT